MKSNAVRSFSPNALLAMLLFGGSLIFMVLNRKAYQYAYLPFLINLTTIVVILSLPPLDSNKRYFKWETNMFKYAGSNCPCNLYVEYYCVFGGGATATDMDAVYLTDKKKFRLYLGKYDEGDERIDIKCNRAKITVTKTGTGFTALHQSAPNIIERKTFYLNQLINDSIFE